MLSPENKALISRVADYVEHRIETYQPIEPEDLNRLLDAAREQGRRSVVDQHLVENGEAFYIVKGESSTLRWEPNGENLLLMQGEKFVGHFYTDASDGVDVDAVLKQMVR